MNINWNLTSKFRNKQDGASDRSSHGYFLLQRILYGRAFVNLYSKSIYKFNSTILDWNYASRSESAEECVVGISSIYQKGVTNQVMLRSLLHLPILRATATQKAQNKWLRNRIYSPVGLRHHPGWIKVQYDSTDSAAFPFVEHYVLIASRKPRRKMVSNFIDNWSVV